LAHIFGFGHTQSDDVQVKKAAPAFIKNVIALFKDHDIVIADKLVYMLHLENMPDELPFCRNNHLRQHRQALREATARFSPPVRLLALNWSLDQPLSTIHRICGDRVLHRGENHQSLRADTKAKAHEDVIWQFITGTEELAESEVDASIEMELEEPLDKALQRAVEGCVKVLGLPMPSEEKVKEALDVANGYVPKVKKTGDTRKKDVTARYFGLLPEIDLDEVLGKRLLLGNDVSKESKDFWTHLKTKSRVPARPHVTIVHKNSLPAEVHLWDRCLDLHKMQVPPLFKFRLGNVVWNDRVMAATVDELELDSDEDSGGKGHEFVSTLPHDVRERLHITVGTRDTSVPAVEAKGLVEKWRAGDLTGNVQSIKLEGVAVKGRIKGMF
jgi:tRNA ligase